MGHIDAESQKSRRLSEVARAVFADERELEKEFSRRIGSRAFKLLRRIGEAEKSTFHQQLTSQRINTVRTSKPLEFTLPNIDAGFSLRLEVDHMAQAPLLKMIPPRTFWGVGAQLSRHDQDSVRKQIFQLTSSEFESGTSINNTKAGYRRGAIESYSRQTARFINLLDFTEELLDGALPQDLHVPEESIIFSAGARLLDTQDIIRPAIEG